MSKGIQLRIWFVRLLVAVVVAASSMLAIAQKSPQPNRSEGQEPSAAQVPTVDKKPSPADEKPRFPRLDRQVGRVSLPVTRGVRLRVENRTSGRITVRGWDRDVIEAHAVSARGEEVLIVAQNDDGGPKAVFLKADYANLDNPATPTLALELPPVNANGPIQVQLEVNVPRYAEFEVVKVLRSDVDITGVETPLLVIGQQSSNVTLKDVGSVEVHTRSGSITVESARGIADLTSSTGSIKVSNSRGAVRAISIAGAIEIRCFKGRVDVVNTQAPIELVGIDGDVEVIAASSNVRFTGSLTGDGRYYLKSMTGRVEMIIPSDTRGFNATLTSYRGQVESDFSLRPKPSAVAPDGGHRLAGRFGNGSPQITLDSFEGLVKLTKVASSSLTACP